MRFTVELCRQFMRKPLLALVTDVKSFISGTTPLREAVGTNDDWLHPIDCRFMLDDQNAHFGPFDNAGIPMQRFGELEPVYVPSRVAAFAFAHWHNSQIEQNAESRAAFVRAAQWFGNHMDGRIEHAFPLAGMNTPWLSCLAQGEAISVLARHYFSTGDTHSLKQARAASDWMRRRVEDGGTCASLPGGGPFLEEYPGSRHRHVLNGCLYGVVGMLDLLRVVDDKQVAAFNQSVVDSIASAIESWEIQGWSLYDYPENGTRPNFNTPGYQRVHIALLRYVGRTMNVDKFVITADRLETTLKRPVARMRALAGKMRYRVTGGW